VIKLDISKIEQLLVDLRRNKSSGASELIKDALKIMKVQLDLIQDRNVNITKEFYSLFRKIINSRPTMAPLINFIGYLLHDLSILTKNTLEKRIKQFEIEEIEKKKTLENIFHKFLKAREKDLKKIMLISYSSTILNLLEKNKDFNLEIFVLESRPLLEGRSTAKYLSKYFKTTLIIDAAMGKFLEQTDLVLIGIDSILKDGSIINKIGSYPLTALCKLKNIDAYAVGDSYKYNLRSHYGHEILIEKKLSSEVFDIKVDTNIDVVNYYFEVIPADYISGIISDLGVMDIQDFIESVKNMLPIEWFKYFINDKESSI
jgi:translation initiation factor 2B subunit (eIF-2B alpha/beta/delta family)